MAFVICAVCSGNRVGGCGLFFQKPLHQLIAGFDEETCGGGIFFGVGKCKTGILATVVNGKGNSISHVGFDGDGCGMVGGY